MLPAFFYSPLILYASATGWSDFTNIVEIEDQNMGLDQIHTDPRTETIYDLSGNRVQQVEKAEPTSGTERSFS